MPLTCVSLLVAAIALSQRQDGLKSLFRSIGALDPLNTTMLLSTRLYCWHACVFACDCAIINIITTILDPLRRRSVALRDLIGIL